MTYEYGSIFSSTKGARTLTGISQHTAIPRLHNSVFIS